MLVRNKDNNDLAGYFSKIMREDGFMDIPTVGENPEIWIPKLKSYINFIRERAGLKGIDSEETGDLRRQ